MDAVNGHTEALEAVSIPIAVIKDSSRSHCEGCSQHLATIKLLTDMTHQQALIMKEQQQSIANLITQNATYQQHITRNMGTPARAIQDGGIKGSAGGSSKAGTATRRPNPGIAKKTPAKALGNKGTPSQLASSLMKKRGRPSKTSSKAMAPLSKEDVRSEDDEATTAAQEIESPGPHRVEKSGEEDAIEVTRIWITATPAPKTRCPLPECEKRNFNAADMYHFRRHFLQIHKLTHPNPEFIFQCPVEDCSVEFENSLKNAKEHMRQAHPELFPRNILKTPTPAKKSNGKKKQVEVDDEDMAEPEGVDEAAEEPAAEDAAMDAE